MKTTTKQIYIDISIAHVMRLMLPPRANGGDACSVRMCAGVRVCGVRKRTIRPGRLAKKVWKGGYRRGGRPGSRMPAGRPFCHRFFPCHVQTARWWRQREAVAWQNQMAVRQASRGIQPPPPVLPCLFAHTPVSRQRGEWMERRGTGSVDCRRLVLVYVYIERTMRMVW